MAFEDDLGEFTSAQSAGDELLLGKARQPFIVMRCKKGVIEAGEEVRHTGDNPVEEAWLIVIRLTGG